MYINLIIEQPAPDFGDTPGRIFTSPDIHAKLIFELPTATVTFWNYGRNPGEAVLKVINSFLAGIDEQIRVRFKVRREYGYGIQFADHIHSDIKTMIEQAIDLKTGNDRNKLTGLMALPE